MWMRVLVTVVVVAAVVVGAPDGYQKSYPARPYHYNYAVHDDYHDTHFHHGEKSDGNAVQGRYTVALPDGRKQHVDYSADHYKGYLAKVTYEGQAKHPKTYGPPVTFFKKGEGYH